jgi:subtilisin-like proprotein convertase family protein
MVLDSAVGGNPGFLTTCGSGLGFVGTIIDDEAPTTLPIDGAPWTGSFNTTDPSNQPLSTFDGLNAAGTWTLFVTDEDGQGDVGTIDGWCLTLTVAPPLPDVYVCSTDVGQAISDFTTVSSTLEFPFGGTIADVDIQLDIAYDCGAALEFVLTAPDGTSALFIESYVDGGILLDLGCGAFTGTIIDDIAPTSLAAGAIPYTGTFNATHPTAQPLSTLNGGPAAGTWTLTITDEDGFGNSGTIDGWCLRVATLPTCEGDVNGDGAVDVTDLLLVLGAWGMCF